MLRGGVTRGRVGRKPKQRSVGEPCRGRTLNPLVSDSLALSLSPFPYSTPHSLIVSVSVSHSGIISHSLTLSKSLWLQIVNYPLHVLVPSIVLEHDMNRSTTPSPDMRM